MLQRILSPVSPSLLVLAMVGAGLGAQDPPTAEVAGKAQAGAAPAAVRVPFVKPDGVYADLAEMGFDPMRLLTGGNSAPPKPFYPLLENLESLAKVPEPQVLLDLSGTVGLNLPQLREVERALSAVRAAGKQIVCYLENGTPTSYQLAALCDTILLADMGGLDLRSPAMTVTHLKDALDLVGVQAEVTRVGAFKGAVEPYLLPEMSQHLRQHYQAMLASMNEDLVRRIASGRKLAPSRVRELQGQRLVLAKEALAAGLVDALVPWTGAKRALAVFRGGDGFELHDQAPKKKAQNRDLMSLFTNLLKAKKEEAIEDPVLVVLHLAGEIVDGDQPNAGSMVSGPSCKLIDELAANQHVKGVVVRINSPGGSATASEAIRQALLRLAAVKPVAFSMGELAASGGYWITAIGRPIFAEATTLTGSIGVFGMRFQTGALMRRLGVRSEVVALDDGPLFDQSDRPWSDEARARMQTMVDDVYARFLAQVASSRGTTVAAIDAVAGGRVWSGAQAKERGLVDHLGGVGDAVAFLRREAQLGAEVELEHRPEPKNFADSLFSSMFESRVRALGATEALRLLCAEAPCGEVFAVLQQALADDGRPRLYAQLPMGLRVR